jgi:hypothetical protein
LERDDRYTWSLVSPELSSRRPATHGGVVAQVWRGGDGRQAVLARALTGIRVAPLDDELGRRAGLLLARSQTSDAIGAAVVAMAAPGDRILTTDAADISDLVAASGLRVHVIPV